MLDTSKIALNSVCGFFDKIKDRYQEVVGHIERVTGEGGVHLAKVGLHLLGDVLQFLHLPLGLEHRLGDLGLDAGGGTSGPS